MIKEVLRYPIRKTLRQLVVKVLKYIFKISTYVTRKLIKPLSNYALSFYNVTFQKTFPRRRVYRGELIFEHKCLHLRFCPYLIKNMNDNSWN